MSASELLHRIEELPASERLWLIEQLLRISQNKVQEVEETGWSNFSAGQLLEQYAPQDSVYDQD